MTEITLLDQKALELAKKLAHFQPEILVQAFADEIKQGFLDVLKMAQSGELPAVELPQAPKEEADPKDLSHRSIHYRRTEVTGQAVCRASRREKALSQAWEGVNVRESMPPILATLLSKSGGTNLYAMQMVSPFNQSAATAAATVIQWMGSEGGFDFLKQALEVSGYTIVDAEEKKKK
ncbi:hypothetical protein RYA05_02920 [Pseudomonas syringae pv. actinidiae]|nr:hypothetical protein [Pseudomonas syringae pv. actinidiae]